MEIKDENSIIQIIEKKENQRNEDEKNKLIKFYDDLGNINNNFHQKDILDILYNYFSKNIDKLVYLYEIDSTKNSQNKYFYQILFDLYSEYGEKTNIIKDILNLLLDQITLEKEKIYYILRIIGSMIREGNINYDKFYNLISLLNILFNIKEKNIFLLGGVNILLPLYEFINNNYNEIKNKFNEKDIFSLLFEIIKILMSDDKNSQNFFHTNFFSYLTFFLNIVESSNYILIIKSYINQIKKKFTNDLFNKSFLLNISIVEKITFIYPSTLDNLLSDIYHIFEENKMYLFIQIVEMKSILSDTVFEMLKNLFKQLSLKEKIYFMNLLNEMKNPKNLNKIINYIIYLDDDENSHKRYEYVEWEYVNSIINLLFNKSEILEESQNIMNYIFKKLLKYNLLNNIINPFFININKKIELSKKIINLEQNDITYFSIELEINFLTYIIQYLNKINFGINNLKLKRNSEEIKELLNKIINKDNLNNIEFLLIELLLCSYLKKNLLIEEQNCLFHFLCNLYKEIAQSNVLFRFNIIVKFIDFIVLSKFPKYECQIIFQIFNLIYKEIFFNKEDNYPKELREFEISIDKIFQQKFKVQNEILKEDFIVNYVINQFLKTDKVLYKHMSDLDINIKEFGNYKNEYIINLSIHYFIKITLEQNNVETAKSYFKFFEMCKYFFFNEKNINIIFPSQKQEENKTFLFNFFKVHLKFISFKIISLHDGEIKNIFYLIFIFIIKFISYCTFKKKIESYLNNILNQFESNLSNDKKEYEIDLLCQKILNQNLSSINYPLNSENEITKFDLYQLNYELFEDETYIELFNLKKSYKQLKKQLFSFNGPYSKPEIFYSENNNNRKLIYKISNHLTSEFTQPLLVPILDYKSYLPNKNMYDDKIFKNNHKDFYNIDLSLNVPDNLLFFDKYFSGFNVCYVDKLSHYQGKLQLFTNHLIFYSLYFEINKEKIKYPKNFCRGGSFKTNKKKYYLIKYSEIKFLVERVYLFENDALEIYTETKSYLFEFINEKERNYFIKIFLEKTDLEKINKKLDEEINNINIEIKKEKLGKEKKETNKLFKNNEKKKEEKKDYEKENIINILEQEKSELEKKKKIFENCYYEFKPITTSLKQNKNQTIGYLNTEYEEFKNIKEYKDIINLWKKNEISTLYFLMLSNILSNRSLNDLGQYPVFPWLIKYYNITESTLEKKNLINTLITDHKRDLSIPIGLNEINEKGKKRKENYINLYKACFEGKKIQLKSDKKFPDYDYDLEQYIKDPKINYEDIPYVFGSHFSNPAYVCHFLTKLFPYTLCGIEIQGKGFDAPDRLFINIDKTYSNCFTEKGDLRELIPQFFYLPEMFININNLEFGNLQKPVNFQNNTYDIFIQMGKGTGEKNDIVNVNDTLLPKWCDNNEYKFISLHREILEKGYSNIEKWCDLMFGINLRGSEAQKIGNIFMYYSYWESINYRKNILRKNNELNSCLDLYEFGQSPIQIIDYNIFKKDIIKKEKYNDFKKLYVEILFEQLKKPKIEFGKNENSIDIITKILKDKKEILDQSKITYLEIEHKFKLIFCGTEKGSILIIENNKNFNLYKAIYDHNKEINFICSHHKLNMFISCSKDCFINIYTLPKVKLVSSIYLKDNIPIYSYLSLIPIACIIIYVEGIFLLYDLKGNFISQKKLENSEKFSKTPSMKIDLYFNEYLFYNEKYMKIFFFEDLN